MISSFSGDYAFLSNFWPYERRPIGGGAFIRGEYLEPPFDCKGRLVKTVEHAFQAQKTLDKAWREDILAARTPGLARRLGRNAPLRPRWDAIRVGIMREILTYKFAPGSALAERLLATGEEELVEGNTWGDKFWGCVREPHEHGVWVGANHLGLLLMERREALRDA